METIFYDNLIYTEYIHNIQLLQVSSNVIPEVEEVVNDLHEGEKELKFNSVNSNETANANLIALDEQDTIKINAKKEDITEIGKTNIIDASLLEFDYSRYELAEDLLNISVSPKPDNLQLINNFIEKNPRIRNKDKTNLSEKDLSVDSIKEKPELLTETLIKIYIDQKAYEKAIFAYEKLSLKYPKKSIYFATQIKKIKKLSNNNIN